MAAKSPATKKAAKKVAKKDEVATEAAQEPQDDAQEATEAPEASPEVQDAEKRGGVKEGSLNDDGMAIEQKQAEQAEVKDALPSFFIDREERKKVELDILTSKSDGRIMSVVRSGMGLDFEKDFSYLTHTRVWFEFTLPDYEQMVVYRQRCSVFRREAGQMLVDKMNLRNHILVWHLKAWNLTDVKGEKVEFTFDEEGSLSDESMAKVYSTHTTIIDVVMTTLEKDSLLT